MSDKLKMIEADMMAARKARNAPLVGALGMLVSKIRLLAKNDGNRDVTDSDVLSSVAKTVKEVNETRDALVKGGRSTEEADYEISVVSAYLPRQLSEGELRASIMGYMETCPDPKKARGHVMKNLAENHKGAFDSAQAQAILASLLA